jgi:sterol desaturase/sphingolipid hydroxylase (fatty acid hydroxylase superfamily)
MPHEANERLLSFARSCLEPLLELLDPSKRLFWPYLLSAALLATGVWWLRVRSAGRTTLLGFLFPARVWLHRSALVDYRFLLLRALLAALLLPPALLSAQRIALSLALALTRTLGPGPGAGLPPLWGVAALTALTFVLGDLARFLAHLALHRSPVLWEFHKVHHSAEVLTPFTLHRTHPLEAAWMRGATVLALGASAGLCAWFFRGRATVWELLGVDALSCLWTFLGSNLRHSHVWLSFGPALEHILLSPAQHQLHHSSDPRHHDRNLGEALAVWDWMAGTLLPSSQRRERLTFGLSPGDEGPGTSAWSLLLTPVQRAARRLLAPPGRTRP